MKQIKLLSLFGGIESFVSQKQSNHSHVKSYECYEYSVRKVYYTIRSKETRFLHDTRFINNYKIQFLTIVFSVLFDHVTKMQYRKEWNLEFFDQNCFFSNCNGPSFYVSLSCPSHWKALNLHFVLNLHISLTLITSSWCETLHRFS